MPHPLFPLACVLSVTCSGATQEPRKEREEPVQRENDQEHAGRKPLPSPEEIAKLPPDGGPEYNRLIFEQSPYLLQHAANPVDWYPWGDAAFERARADDKPIFLSIGYSTCHWCHVMENESFEDPEIAALMNAAFVCIKVDREERPDVDHLYMQVTQAMTGSGGWPMTVVMTPDKKPFFSGTYFPKEARFGRPGMRELVARLSAVWRDQRDQVLAHADSVADFMRKSSEGAVGGELGAEVLGLAFRQLSDAYEPEFGGFSDQPKFPTPHNLLFLLQYNQRRGDSEALAMVEHTLQRMRLGGIFDQVGFGFHRYSTDRRWLVPHFEKMLYDQAMLVMAYTAAWQVTGKDAYRATAEEVLAYVQRDMTSPEGAFYSAEDADSEGEEGRFYLWTTAELREVLGEEEGRLVARVFGATDEGNFAEGSGGANILHLEQPLDDQAEDLGLTADALRGRVEAARAKLFAWRERRVHPLKDDKVLTDWNGLMVAALARAGRAFDEPRHVAAAARAADFLLANVRADDGRMLKRSRLGAAGLPGTLDDHAFLAWGLLELYEATLDPRWLREALALTDAMTAHFRDAEQGGFFIAADDVEGLLSRGKDAYDGAIPSGTSVAAWNLLRLARITGRTELEEEAAATLRSFSASVARQPAAFTQLLAAVDLAVGPSFEIVVAGDPAAADTRAMLAAFQRRFLPHTVLLLRPPGEAPPITELAPYTLEQTALDGRATAFVCRDFACKEPTTDVETALGFLDPAAWK